MAQDIYSGSYAKFYALDPRGADFIGADNLVGDKYDIDIRDDGEGYRAYLVNRFGHDVGYLEASEIRSIQLAQAKGWVSHAFLSFAAFTEGRSENHPSSYWGEVAILLYDSKISSEMERFEGTLSRKMADGARPRIDFGQQSLDKLLNDPSWFPTSSVAKPKMGKGSTIVKDHRTPNERMVEQARKGNIGCYIAGWGFIIAIIALIVFGLHSCGLF
jgi:hypothetical protein